MKSAEQWSLVGERRGFISAIRQAQAEAYAAGQQAMREAASDMVEDMEWDTDDGSCPLQDVLRTLPIQPLPETQTAEGE